MAYVMTDDFASTMVTVIPIVLIVGTAEVASLSRGPWEVSFLEPNDTMIVRAFFAVRLMAKAGLIAWWSALVTAHVSVEVDLIMWLAHPDHPDTAALAERVVLVSTRGFYFVLVITLLFTFVRITRAEHFLLIELRRLGQPRRRSQAEQSRPPRQRIRPLYPAHRAVRRPPRRTRAMLDR